MATFDPFTEQIIGLREQQALAQKLRDQGMQAPEGQTVSGVYVAPKNTQYLAQALKSYLGGQDVQQAQQGIKDLMAQRQAENANFLAAMPKATETQVEVRTPEMMNQMGPSPLSRALRVNPSVEDQLAYAAKAPGISPVDIGNLAVKGAELQAGREARIAEAQLKAQERAQEMAQRQQDREREQSQRQQDRLDQMKFAASMRPIPPERIVNILGPSGESVATPISQVPQGASLWSPQAAKFAQENASKGTGRSALSDTLDVLAGQYNALNEGMGMPSTQNKWGSNLGAKLATTGPGQWLGQVAGTENQKARDIISQTRPLLLADIKKATGMTASEMNSNAELQMWLSVATDPQKGYEANMEALKNLENKFGLGRAKDGNPFTKAAPAGGTIVPVSY
jgi:hypothetical protein